jgi:hypothetical protein
METIEESKLRRSITLGEVLAVSVIIIGSVLLFWKTTDIRLSELELRMNLKEQKDQVINDKLDKLQDGINDVRLTLKDKQDRKN